MSFEWSEELNRVFFMNWIILKGLKGLICSGGQLLIQSEKNSFINKGQATVCDVLMDMEKNEDENDVRVKILDSNKLCINIIKYSLDKRKKGFSKWFKN